MESTAVAAFFLRSIEVRCGARVPTDDNFVPARMRAGAALARVGRGRQRGAVRRLVGILCRGEWCRTQQQSRKARRRSNEPIARTATESALTR